MIQLDLTFEQAEIVKGADQLVVLRAPNGEMMGVVARGMVIESLEDDAAFILQSKERAAPTSRSGSTTREVLDRLQGLEPAR